MQFNIADLFESVVDALPNREALVCDGVRRTFAQLDEHANRLAHYLSAQGVGAGDHVGIYAYNCVEWLESMIAAFKIRAVPININYRYVEEELRYLFDNADLVALVHHRGFSPRVAAVANRVARLTTFVSIEDGSEADLGPTASVPYDRALQEGSPDRDFPGRSADDLYILYTGGTTGMPKGVMWRHEDIYFAALSGFVPAKAPEEVAERAASHPGSVMLTGAPLIHAAAQWGLWISLLDGARVVLGTVRSFDPATIWRLASDEGAAVLSIVGDAMARPLADVLALRGGEFDLSGLKLLASGGAVLSPGVVEELQRHIPHVRIHDSFGGSETGVQARAVPAGEGGLRFRADERNQVLDDDLKPLAAGSPAIGRLAKSGPIPLGYYKDPEKSAATFVEVDGKRWSLLGDLAQVEEDGTISVLGRGSMCINTGGEKVFPEEVEAALKSHPAVFDALVVGLADDRWGERVVAVLQARGERRPNVEELADHCRGRIAGYKVPRSIHWVETLERQPSGKPDYRWAKAIASR